MPNALISSDSTARRPIAPAPGQMTTAVPASPHRPRRPSCPPPDERGEDRLAVTPGRPVPGDREAKKRTLAQAALGARARDHHIAGGAKDKHARVERMLFVRCAAGDLGARDALAVRYLPLASSLARRCAGPGEAADDLVQVASLALIKAIDRFDHTRGAAFSSFAVPTIAGELKRHLRDHTWMVRPPRAVQELSLRVEHATRRLSQDLDRAPTVSELAADVGSDEVRILEARHAQRGRHAISLHGPAGADGQITLEDTLGSPDEGLELAESRAVLAPLMARMPPRSRELLVLRFEQDLTQAQIAARLGIGQMQTSRQLDRALMQLRTIAEHHAAPAQHLGS